MLGFSPTEWGRLSPLLEQALELEGAAQNEFLTSQCAGDEALRARLDRLIAAARIPDGFLDVAGGPAALAMIGPDDSEYDVGIQEGGRVGPYRVLHQLGHGGMGRVYLAERADGLWERQVALKLLRLDFPSREVLDRFLYERRILARLNHPNIARLLDGGATSEGQPYFAMELVEGSSLIDFCDGHRLTIQERLDLFLDACDAVQYAHQSFIIHRDLKPSNIQVTAPGQVKLLDFGIAKLLDPASDGISGTVPLTRVGQPAMTPEYAAPEQLLGLPVTTATDVYSLGVVLYELLTGHRPYRFERQTPAEIERVVCGHLPLRPSAAVTRHETIRRRDGTTDTVTPEEVANARRVRPDRLKRHLRGDLEMIVLRALHKEPERRYQTAAALALDLRNYIAGRPVQARPEALSYRVRRFATRNRWGVAGIAVLIAVMAAGIGATRWQASVASAEAARAGNVKNVILGLFDSFDPQVHPIDSVTGRDILEAGVARAEVELAGQPATQAELLAAFGLIYTRLSDYGRGLPLLERAVQLREAGQPGGDTVMARILSDLGSALSEKGEYDRAQAAHQRALDLRKRLAGWGSPEVTRSLSGLASVRRGKGDFDGAITGYEEVLERDLSHHGPSHELVAEDLGELATTYLRAGRPREAEPYARRALDLRLDVSGTEHVETATAMNNLGVILFRQNDLAAADSLFRAVLDFDRRRFGEDHQYTATAKNNLANILRRKREFAEAERLFQDVVDYDLDVLGRQHRYTPIALRNLAGVQRDRGRFADAERNARNALDINRELYGDRHHQVGNALALLASVAHARGRNAAALRHYEEALEVLEAEAPAHTDAATALLGYGELLADLGRVKDAVPPLRRAVTLRREALGEGPATAAAEVALGRALMALGEEAEAESLLLGARSTLMQSPWSETEHAEALLALADLSRRRGRPAEARRLEGLALGLNAAR